jgi:glycosyltransferase involved in cell wall biosynthesis
VAESLITIVVPSLNQGRYLNDALESIFQQDVPAEVFVMDGGSTDNSIEIIYKWSSRLSGWRSFTDKGQAAAINEGVALGSAPYVCWLNSDDRFLPGGLRKLYEELARLPLNSAVYGEVLNQSQPSGKLKPVWVEPFSVARLAMRCIISQPATLIRRTAWNKVGGLDNRLHMAMDYDLWWKLFKEAGPLSFLNELIAINSIHAATKTNTKRLLHYQEAMKIVKKHYGSIPLKWWIYLPYSVGYKTLINKLKSFYR